MPLLRRLPQTQLAALSHVQVLTALDLAPGLALHFYSDWAALVSHGSKK